VSSPLRFHYLLRPRRDARYLYVTNRGNGSIAVIDFATKKIVGVQPHG
jgi:YVTN family beta-propeller protein